MKNNGKRCSCNAQRLESPEGSQFVEVTVYPRLWISTIPRRRPSRARLLMRMLHGKRCITGFGLRPAGKRCSNTMFCAWDKEEKILVRIHRRSAILVKRCTAVLRDEPLMDHLDDGDVVLRENLSE